MTVLLLVAATLGVASASIYEVGKPGAPNQHASYQEKCRTNGIHYNDKTSYLLCSNGRAFIQHCPPGTRNSEPTSYGSKSYSTHREFCDVNLVDLGYKGTGHSPGYAESGPEYNGYGAAKSPYSHGPLSLRGRHTAGYGHPAPRPHFYGYNEQSYGPPGYGSYGNAPYHHSAPYSGVQQYTQYRAPYQNSYQQPTAYHQSAAYEKPSYEKPAYEKPSYEKPAYEKLSYEKPSYEKPSYEKPSYENPSYENPSYENPSYEKPSYEKPSYEKPSYEKPSYEKPSYEKPSYGYSSQSYEQLQPQFEDSPYDKSTYTNTYSQQPSYQQHSYDKSSYEQPSYEQPSHQPSYKQPTYEKPTYEQPLYEQPKYDAPNNFNIQYATSK